MVLKLEPLQLSDFDILTNHANIHTPNDDLVGPPTPICWPVTTQSQALTRLQFHMAKQRLRFLTDPTVNYVKVVDTENKDIVSIARWHFYPDGYDYSTMVHHELFPPPSSSPDALYPKEMDIDLHNHILSSRDRERSSWQPKGEPCWILMHLVTRPSQRGRGAAKMLINWGTEKAREGGVPAYLEAGVMGKPVYEKRGFEGVREMGVDLKEYGMDFVFVMSLMRMVPC